MARFERAALDHQPVRLVFCLLGDASTAADHLAGLARLARLAQRAIDEIGAKLKQIIDEHGPAPADGLEQDHPTRQIERHGGCQDGITTL